MFGRSFFKEFEEDPFFSDHLERFADPFQALTYEKNESGKQNRSSLKKRSDNDPFSNMFSMMKMGNLFDDDIHKRMKDMDGDNVHSYTSSSVMTFRNDGKGDPKIFQASSSTRRAPGKIREDRKALRDSESGLEKMSIGHHIAERGKVIERRRNVKRGGAYEEQKNFIHIDENEEDKFDNEWRNKTSNLSYTLGVGPNNRRAVEGRRINADKQMPREQGPKKRVTMKTPAAGMLRRPAGPGNAGRSKY